MLYLVILVLYFPFLCSTSTEQLEYNVLLNEITGSLYRGSNWRREATHRLRDKFLHIKPPI